MDFIAEHKGEPFFLYLAHAMPHGPLAASEEIKKSYAAARKAGAPGKGNIYATAINEIDWSVGQILDALKKQGLDENTIVLFTSDNGPARGSAKPLRGKKTQTLEGGQRMPTVIRWPNKIVAGSVNDEVLTAMDILPTFAQVSGATLDAERAIDGKDMMPVLVEGAKSPHEYFFYAYWGDLQAVRWGKWKLRIADGKEALYDLASDISEKKNLADKNPEIVERLKGAMKDFEAEMEEEVRPTIIVENPKPLTLRKKL